jgi:L-ascorbate metabolism protein UlaG (beta-lactamase superfamily)
MVITYFGKSYFKLTLGDMTIAINPPSKASKPTRFGADVALITTNHSDYNDPETVALGDTVPFVVDGPGSYEIHDLLFTGAASEVSIDGKTFINTVYGFELDGIKIAFLGILSDEGTLSLEAKEIAGNADMLFIPIGGGHVFEPAQAYKVANSFGPNVIIPYEYDETTLARFLKEGGQEKGEVQEKATLKRRDLDGKEGFILALSSQA